MKMLVTGGAGFVGSYLCEKYVQEGNKVICLDNFMNGELTNIRSLLSHRDFKLIKGDIRDFDLLEKIIRDVDIIFHLAAQIHVDRSLVEPRMTYEVNVEGTLNILEAARIFDVGKVIYTSTSEVYGSAQHVPMDETHPLAAPHLYGASKIAADRMCNAYIQTYGMPISIIRPFNTFGPRQKSTGYGGVISIFIRRIMKGMPPIIYGNGLQTRDYTYVKDLVNALDLVLKMKTTLPEPLNIGTGKEVRILDLANKIIELCGMEGEIKPVHVEPRPGEVKRLIADNHKAMKILKWKPKYTLDEGLKELIEWYKQYKFEEWEKPG